MLCKPQDRGIKKKKIDVCFHAIRCPNNFAHHCIPSLNCFLRGNLFGLEDGRGPYHGHVDVVWIAGIVIRSASCLGCLGVACGKKRRKKKKRGTAEVRQELLAEHI